VQPSFGGAGNSLGGSGAAPTEADARAARLARFGGGASSTPAPPREAGSVHPNAQLNAKLLAADRGDEDDDPRFKMKSSGKSDAPAAAATATAAADASAASAPVASDPMAVDLTADSSSSTTTSVSHTDKLHTHLPPILTIFACYTNALGRLRRLGHCALWTALSWPS
jgi:hypothetical protein